MNMGGLQLFHYARNIASPLPSDQNFLKQKDAV